MKKIILFFIIIIISIIIMFYFFVIYGLDKLKNKADNKIEQISVVLNNYFFQNKKYPDDIKKYLADNSIDLKVKYFFWKTQIRFEIFNNNLYLKYFFPPLGPVTVYNIVTKEWSGEE